MHGESDQFKNKVDPSLKKYLLTKYKKFKIVIIGDHLKDKALAEKIGAPFVGVLTGNHSADELQLGTTVNTLILNSVRDLKPKMIYSLFKKV